MEFDSLRGVSDVKWKQLAEQRIFFAHQSVGFNIIDGIRDVMRDNPKIKLNIVETSSLESIRGPVFAHARIGNNGVPNSKCEAFFNLIKKAHREMPDIVLLKFCYIDVTSTTDVERVFSSYSNMVSTIEGLNSGLKLIHLTVPLRVVQGGPRAWVKSLINRPIGGFADNIKRAEYNDRLRIEYREKDSVFDLASVESTFRDGKRHTFSFGGKAYEALVPEYSDDGGHLNQAGRRWVAEYFLAFLATLTKLHSA